METSVKPKFQPALCKKSLDMSEQHFKGQFLDRLERDVLRRIDHENKMLTTGNHNNVCTFHPVILEKSEKLRGRSAYEMSRGDLLRRQTNNRMMKLRIEREELNELTFSPEISNLAKNTESALRLKEDPTFFLDFYRSNQAKKINLNKKNILLKAEKELEECTFIPNTIDCPAYVKRIAKSMAAVKAAAAANKGIIYLSFFVLNSYYYCDYYHLFLNFLILSYFLIFLFLNIFFSISTFFHIYLFTYFFLYLFIYLFIYLFAYSFFSKCHFYSY